MLAAVVAAVALAGCGGAASMAHPSQAHQRGLHGPRPPQGDVRAPPFRLADARGGVFDSRRLAGRPYAVTFVYTRCTDECPIAAELRQALAELGAAARRVAVVAITVDPRHDTPAAARRWLARHDEPANFHYLLGSSRTLTPLWNRFYVDGQDTRYPTGTDTHSALIYLVDRRGRERAVYQANQPLDPRDLAHDLGVLLREG